ncbi:MAG: Hpt domain-containing protein, partial [Xanthobacteraceae bacterium]
MAEVSAKTAEHTGVAVRADAPPLAPFAQAPGRVVDLAHLARMTQGDRGLERDVLELFAMQGDVLLARMRGQTPEAIGTLAHTLCGSARGIGAWAVAQAAEAAERSAL